MSKQINKKFLFTTLVLISLVLISAFVIEYKMDHKPCRLCLYERIPYFLAVFLIIKIFFIRSYEKLTLLILFLVFMVSSVLAFYHFGIEQGFFEESFACTVGNFSETLSKEEILEQLKQNTISCKDVSFKVLGLSLAAINAVFSFVLGVIFLKLFMSYGKN
jgi:disulfide bond formation protein DsbB